MPKTKAPSQKIADQPQSEPQSEPQPRPVQELVTVRAPAEHVAQVLEAMPRTADITKVRMHEYFVEGKSIPEIAALHGCSVGLVANAVRRVRVELPSSDGPGYFVNATVTLPTSVARDLIAFSEALMLDPDSANAGKALKEFSRAIASARKKLEGL